MSQSDYTRHFLRYPPPCYSTVYRNVGQLRTAKIVSVRQIAVYKTLHRCTPIPSLPQTDRSNFSLTLRATVGAVQTCRVSASISLKYLHMADPCPENRTRARIRAEHSKWIAEYMPFSGANIKSFKRHKGCSIEQAIVNDGNKYFPWE